MKLTIEQVAGYLFLGLSLIILGLMMLLGYHDLMTPYYLVVCIVLISLFAIIGSAYTDNKRIKKGETSTLLIIVCSILCVVIAASMVWVGVLIADKPDAISYGGSGHIVGSFDNGIVFYQDEDGWTMIIPENYGEPNMNHTVYYTYHWNGTTWIFIEEE